jgi:hypothetical protein
MRYQPSPARIASTRRRTSRHSFSNDGARRRANSKSNTALNDAWCDVGLYGCLRDILSVSHSLAPAIVSGSGGATISCWTPRRPRRDSAAARNQASYSRFASTTAIGRSDRPDRAQPRIRGPNSAGQLSSASIRIKTAHGGVNVRRAKSTASVIWGVTHSCSPGQAARGRRERWRARRASMASPPESDQRMPARFIRRWTTWSAADSIAPEPIGRPSRRNDG